MSTKPGAPGGARPDKRRSARKPRSKEEQEETPRKVELRANYVISVVAVSLKKYGSYAKLAKMVMQQFGVARNAADRSVTRAYEVLDERLAKFRENAGTYLLHVHRKTIEKGFREDGRLITPASKALAQLVGAEAPQGVHLSGGTNSTMGISADDRVLLESLKLTNAQRLATIDQVEKELADEAAEHAAPVVEPILPEDDAANDLVDRVVRENMPTGNKRVLARRQPHPAEGDEIGLGEDDAELEVE